MVSTRRLIAAAVVVAVFLGLSALCGAQQVGVDYSFFKGKVIEFIVPYSVGGGFDTYSRAVKPYLEKYIPGVTVIVKNITGGGGLTGTNQLYRANPDGLTIGIINGAGMIFNQLLGGTEVRFDLTKMSWIGRITAEAHVIGVGAKAPFRTVQDLQKAGRTIVFSATGVGSDDYFGSIIAASVLGVNIRNVVGFEGSSEANMAVIRGDVEGTATTLGTLLPLIESGDIKPIVQLAVERDPLLPGTPTLAEVAPENQKAVALAICSIFAFDRVIGGPPGIPEGRLQALREALQKALADPELVDWSQKAKRSLTPLDGEKTAKLVHQAFAAGETIKPMLEKASKK